MTSVNLKANAITTYQSIMFCIAVVVKETGVITFKHTLNGFYLALGHSSIILYVDPVDRLYAIVPIGNIIRFLVGSVSDFVDLT